MNNCSKTEKMIDGETFDIRQSYLHCFITMFSIFFLIFIYGSVNVAVAAGRMLDLGVLAIVTLIFAGLSLLLSICVFLLRDKYKYLQIFLIGILILCLINYLLIPFQAGILDGRDELTTTISDDIIPLLRNIGMLVVCMGMVALLRRYLQFVPVAIFAFLAIFTVTGIVSMQGSVPQNGDESYANEQKIESATTFTSTGKNIIVIGIDSLEGSWMERIFINYPHFMGEFDGFTMFSRAFSSYPFTRFSRQTIQSGPLPISDATTYRDYYVASLSDSFLTDIQVHGARVNAVGYMPDWSFSENVPYLDRIMPERYWDIYGSMVSTSLARITGYWMPNPFAPTIWGGTLDLKQDSAYTLNELIERGGISDSDQDKLLYMWNVALHSPQAFSRDGKMGTPVANTSTDKMIDENYFVYTQLTHLFKKMKSLSIYDNSLIIIVSDHGTGTYGEAWEGHAAYSPDFSHDPVINGNLVPATAYNSTLLIKPPNAQGQTNITHDPAWSGDVREIINYYYSNFGNISPIDVVANIRADNPVVGVMFAPFGSDMSIVNTSSEYYEMVDVSSLYEIPAAFATHSDIEGE